MSFGGECQHMMILQSNLTEEKAGGQIIYLSFQLFCLGFVAVYACLGVVGSAVRVVGQVLDVLQVDYHGVAKLLGVRDCLALKEFH